MAQQFATVVGEQHPLPLAEEEPAAEILLQCADGVADGALREVQRPSRLCETALTRQHGEGAQLPRIEEGRIHV